MRLLALALLPALLLACGAPAEAPSGAPGDTPRATSPSLPAGLIVAPGATNLRTPEAYEGAVMYDVQEAYPADTLLAFLRKELESRGFTPQEGAVFTPGVESSHVRGWAETVIEGHTHGDAEPSETVHVYEWTGEWRDASGGVVSYSLMYQDPEASRPYGAGSVSVRGIYIGKEGAEALKGGLANTLKRPS